MTSFVRRLRMIALAGCMATAPAISASAQSLPVPERVVLGAFNVCWEAEDGANVYTVAHEYGFIQPPQATNAIFHRDVEGAVVFLSADFGPGADGQSEPACRITVLRPQIDTPYLRRMPILSEPGTLIQQIADASATMGSGYKVISMREPHPRRAGRMRTVLRQDNGTRARLIYIEEGPTAYEFLYVNGARSVVNDPATADLGTDPAGRIHIQAFVDDRWEIAFCDLNPHACLTDAQVRAMAQADAEAARRARASEQWVLPFSGIGSSGGDNRSNEQRLRDEAWWENYHRCGRGRC